MKEIGRRESPHGSIELTVGLLLWMLLASLLFSAPPAKGQSISPGMLSVPTGTLIQAKLMKHVPMRVGAPIEAVLAYPIYVDSTLALSAGTVLRGTVSDLKPDRLLRKDARLNLDFTPYHQPTVNFTSIKLADGNEVPISTSPASDAALPIHLSPPAAKERNGLVAKGRAAVKDWVASTKKELLSPGRGDRFLQLLYRQLPYHPERIPEGTTWTCELSQPVMVLANSEPVLPETNNSGVSRISDTGHVKVHAYLDQELTSSKAKVGEQFNATVSEPVRAKDQRLSIPQGATLVGRITQAKAARSFHRDGSLRFDIRQLQISSGSQEQVMASVTGIETTSEAGLEMDAEGGIKRHPPGRFAIPLLLGVLANRTLDADSSVMASAAVGSNGMGLIGRIVGMTAASRQVAAGVGFYGTAVSIYRRWLRHGRDVRFPRYNRIEIEISRRPGDQLSQP